METPQVDLPVDFRSARLALIDAIAADPSGCEGCLMHAHALGDAGRGARGAAPWSNGLRGAWRDDRLPAAVAVKVGIRPSYPSRPTHALGHRRVLRCGRLGTLMPPREPIDHAHWRERIDLALRYPQGRLLRQVDGKRREP